MGFQPPPRFNITSENHHMKPQNLPVGKENPSNCWFVFVMIYSGWLFVSYNNNPSIAGQKLDKCPSLSQAPLQGGAPTHNSTHNGYNPSETHWFSANWKKGLLQLKEITIVGR